jgi:hypothetical protein
MILFSPLVAGIPLALALTGYAVRAFLRPLNKIPGPWFARFTSLVLKWHEMRADRTMWVHRLHLQYGPVVRVAPNEIVFASAEAVKEIYGSGGSGYDKTEFYDLFKVYGRRCVHLVCPVHLVHLIRDFAVFWRMTTNEPEQDHVHYPK